jgi:putative hemolysin
MTGRKGKEVKMARKALCTLFMLIGLVVSAACSSKQASPTPVADMPNPASVYCEEHGGKVDLRQDASGGVAGVCVFADGSECDEWAYFRGECEPGNNTPQGTPTPDANMPNPASVYCGEHGGTVELRQDASGGVAGICVFADGSECDEWAYYRGECRPGDSVQPGPTAEATLPNPASVYCEEKGGTVDLRQDASGGVAGICVFADGSECDEWAYYRGECTPGGTPQANPTPTPMPTEQASPPSDPVGARDAVLAYLGENYADRAPAAGLAWMEAHTKPEGLVGGESYEYTAGDWLIAVSYPVVAPENVIYTIVVSDETNGFRWEGHVDAQGQVTEISFAGQSSRPSDLAGARDAALAYLAENYVGEAPAANLAWIEAHTTPEGLVGGESYEYTAGGWLIKVSYPVVAPENVVYTIVVSNQTTGFHWEGQVDAQGQVAETSAGTELASDGWRIYRNEALGYSFQCPAEAEIITADNPLRSLTVYGPGMGDEFWAISHPSDREEYRPPQGVDLSQWLTDHNLVGEVRLDDLQIAGTTAIHYRHERSPQSYADDRYYFARDGQLYQVLIGHGEVEDWELDNRFLQSFQFGEAASITSAPTAIPTPMPFDAADYQGFWTYTHPDPNFTIMLPEDWVVEETTTSNPLMNGHTLNLHPRLQGEGVEGLLIRMSFRRVGEEALLWPTGVGAGEFVPQGTLEVAGQPARRVYFVCPTGQIQSVWYQGVDSQPNIQRGDLEFGFIFSLTGFYCEEGHSLGGKVQRVGEMIIASLRVP